MCIIITAPAGNAIPEDHLKNGFDGNDDGAGIAIAVNGEVIVNKFLKYDDFIKYYRTVSGKYPTVVHFRIGTQGTKDTSNVHPFMIHDIAMFHNGVFSHDRLKHKTKSDTSMLSDILNGLPEGWFTNDAIMHLLEAYCGYNSKLVFMNGAGDIEILNEKAGEWLDGRWYSNTSYKTIRSFARSERSYDASYYDKFYPKSTYNYGTYGGYNYGGKTQHRPSSIMGTSKFDDEEDVLDTEFGYWYNEGYSNNRNTKDDADDDEFVCECCDIEKPFEDMIDWNGHPVCVDCFELIGSDNVDLTIQYKKNSPARSK